MSYIPKPETLEKQARAQKEWHAKHTEYLNIGLRKGQRNRYRMLSERKGVSLASIVKTFLDEACEKEFGEMLKTFIFEGIEGQILVENPVPNKYGNICVRFTWGDIEEYPTFRSVKDIDRFAKDPDELANFIDQAAHNS